MLNHKKRSDHTHRPLTVRTFSHQLPDAIQTARTLPSHESLLKEHRTMSDDSWMPKLTRPDCTFGLSTREHFRVSVNECILPYNCYISNQSPTQIQINFTQQNGKSAQSTRMKVTDLLINITSRAQRSISSAAEQ